MPKSHHGKKVKPGDIVGITVSRLNKRREIIGYKVVATAKVTDLVQLRRGSRWRIMVEPEDKEKWFLYTGKVDWAYVHEVVLIERGDPLIEELSRKA